MYLWVRFKNPFLREFYCESKTLQAILAWLASEVSVYCYLASMRKLGMSLIHV